MKFTSRFCIRWASIFWLLTVFPAAWGQQVHIAHCLERCPTGAASNNEIVVRHLFAASINRDTGLADWISYQVLKDSVGVASLLPRFWQADSLLENGVSTDEVTNATTRITQPDLSNQQDRDYRISEFNVDPSAVGRLTPMSSFAGTPFWQELNYLSNMAAIPGDLRLGAWSRLDMAVNALAVEVGQVFVVSGPLYSLPEAPPLRIADGGNRRPVAFFKAVSTDGGQAVYMFPTTLAQHASHCDFRSSQAVVESLSGLALFPEAGDRPDDLHASLACSR